MQDCEILYKDLSSRKRNITYNEAIFLYKVKKIYIQAPFSFWFDAKAPEELLGPTSLP
jgi:hypothetical protein